MAEKAIKSAETTRKRTRSSKNDYDNEQPILTINIEKGRDIKKFINDITAQLYEKIQADFTGKLQESTRFIEGKMEEKTGKLQEQLVRLEDKIKELQKG